MRIVALGGLGNFGAHICRALAPDQSLTEIAARRQRSTAPAYFAALNIQQAQIAYTHEFATLQSTRPLPPISWRRRSAARMHPWAALQCPRITRAAWPIMVLIVVCKCYQILIAFGRECQPT